MKDLPTQRPPQCSHSNGKSHHCVPGDCSVCAEAQQEGRQGFVATQQQDSADQQVGGGDAERQQQLGCQGGVWWHFRNGSDASGERLNGLLDPTVSP